MASFFCERIYQIVRQIPKGKVATYADIATLAGNSRLARAVGNALHVNPYEGDVPCHRVVNSKGMLALHFGFGGLEGQRRRLLAEGVNVTYGRVDLKAYRWNPEDDHVVEN
ncbi:MAG: MGMT family protein [Spirochaetales bacterium]|nr:MGMT family protein [Spirochaetales bacterium]